MVISAEIGCEQFILRLESRRILAQRFKKLQKINSVNNNSENYLLSYFEGRKLELLAEDIGHHIGDGHMGAHLKSDGYIRYEFVYSGGIDDEEYFAKVLMPRKKILYGLKKNNYITRKNELRFCFNSKKLFEFFTEIGIPSGPKDNISVLKWIMNANNCVKVAFLRGLFDADGSVIIRKKAINIIPP